MWSIGVANACEILIPSLGLDEKRFAQAAAAAAAASSKGLSHKKLDKAVEILSTCDKKSMSGLKGQAPFSIAQLKEIGASLAKNCGRWVIMTTTFLPHNESHCLCLLIPLQSCELGPRK
jgi:hypothetical protein